MQKLVFLLAFIVGFQAFAADDQIQAGAKKLNLSKDELQSSQQTLETRCNDLNVLNRFSMGKKECITEVMHDQYSHLVAKNCSEGSDFYFFQCLSVTKGLDVTQETFDFCKGVKEGDKAFSPRTDCLRHLSTSNSTYNKKLLADCYKWINLSQMNVSYCVNVIRDRELPSDLVTSCLIKGGNNSTSSVMEKALNCMAKEAEGTPQVCKSGTSAENRAGSAAPSAPKGVR